MYAHSEEPLALIGGAVQSPGQKKRGKGTRTPIRCTRRIKLTPPEAPVVLPHFHGASTSARKFAGAGTRDAEMGGGVKAGSASFCREKRVGTCSCSEDLLEWC